VILDSSDGLREGTGEAFDMQFGAAMRINGYRVGAYDFFER
jgi:hypothetical protein